MKLFAYVRGDGQINGLVAIPEGQLELMLAPEPGIQVCEIANHGIKGKSIDSKQLIKLRESHTVVITPAHGKLMPRKP